MLLFDPSAAYPFGRIHFTPALAAASISLPCSFVALTLRAKSATSWLLKADHRKDPSSYEPLLTAMDGCWGKVEVESVRNMIVMVKQSAARRCF